MHPVQALNVAYAARARHQKCLKVFNSKKIKSIANSFPHGSAVRECREVQVRLQQAHIDVCNMLITEQRNLLKVGFTSEKLVKKYSRSVAYWDQKIKARTYFLVRRLPSEAEVQAELNEAVATGRMIHD